MRKMISLLIVCILCCGCLVSCGNAEKKCAIEGCENEVYKSGLCKEHYEAANGSNGEVENQNASDDSTEEYENSSSTSDTDIGLKNIKFDTAKGNLSDTEKLVAEYFNTDYIFVNSIEALQRYNKIFDNSLIQAYVGVEKIISYDGDNYSLLVGMVSNSNEMNEYSDEYQNYLEDSRSFIINGSTGDSRFIVGDILQINGRYKGVETQQIDGTSYTVPIVDVHRAYLIEENEDSWYYVEKPSRFSMLDVKNIAKCIFGEDITIRKDSLSDYGVENEDDLMWSDTYNGPCYVCELDNQTNAKFSKYFFNEHYGTLTDAVHDNYEISFSGDFKHFYIFMYDSELESLTLEYYDNNLNKIWKREFENTASASYDVTKNNIYLVANNELYIINTETGEDTFQSVYVGDKLDVRKFSNGLLMISDTKADAFMFVDIEGNVKWRANADKDINSWANIETQYVDDKIVIAITEGEDVYFYVLDANDGTVLYNGTVETPLFEQYS